MSTDIKTPEEIRAMEILRHNIGYDVVFEFGGGIHIRSGSQLNASAIIKAMLEFHVQSTTIPEDAAKWKELLSQESGIYGLEYSEKLDWIQQNVINPLRQVMERLQAENEGHKLMAAVRGDAISELQDKVDALEKQLKDSLLLYNNQSQTIEKRDQEITYKDRQLKVFENRIGDLEKQLKSST